MRRVLAAISIAALVGTGVSTAWSQETTEGPNAHPVIIAQGQSGTPSGGTTSGGATAQPAPFEPAPPPPEPAAPLPPGPPAGPQQAEFFSSPTFLLGTAAATAIIVCAITCFSHSSSTTTSTNVQH